MSKEDLEEVKKILRSTLISSKRCLTVRDLFSQYQDICGDDIPFSKFGFRNTYEFLRSIPDTVRLLDPRNTNCEVAPVTNEKTEHIDRLVREQRASKTKPFSRYGRPRAHPVRRRYQPPRPVMNNDFKKEVYELLQKYPAGMSWDQFDSHAQRILANHYLKDYTTKDVLDKIVEFAFFDKNTGKVFLNNTRHWKQAAEYEEQVDEDESMSMISNDDNNIDEDIPSVSRPQSRLAEYKDEESDDGYPFISDRLRDNFRSLLEDSEFGNGIWLTKLTQCYQLKFGYPLKPKEHGFTDVMDMVANLGSIFHMRQYRAEGDYILTDARKFSQSNKMTQQEEGDIPRSTIEELKKMLKYGHIYTEDLLREYRRMYQKDLQPEQFGFRNLDSFLRHLECTCRDIVFRQIHDRIQLKLNYAPTDIPDERRRSPCEALPGNVTYDPFPSEVCNGDFNLEIDPELTNSKEGQVFAINFGEIYSPSKFFITHVNKVKLLECMMSDLNEFYDANEREYQVLLPLITRGLLCVCKYSRNSQWHRVRVVNNTLGKARIFFIDYGTNEEVSIEKLRYLHKDFAKYPALCMQARLSGIQPKDGQYTNEVCCEFYRLFGNTDLEAKIVRKATNYLEVILYIETEDGRLAAHEILISRCLVELKKNTIDEGLSGVHISKIRNTPRDESSERSQFEDEKVYTGETKLSSDNHIAAPSVESAANETLTKETKAFFDKIEANNPFKENFRKQTEGRNYSWLNSEMPDTTRNTKVTSNQESKSLPKPPPGIQFTLPQQTTDLPSSYGNLKIPAQMPSNISIPYALYDMCGSPHPYYSGAPAINPPFTGSVYPTYQMYYNVPSLPQYSYPTVSRPQTPFRPPPGINTPPVWPSSNVPNTTCSTDPVTQQSVKPNTTWLRDSAIQESVKSDPYMKTPTPYPNLSIDTTRKSYSVNSVDSPPMNELKSPVTLESAMYLKKSPTHSDFSINNATDRSSSGNSYIDSPPSMNTSKSPTSTKSTIFTKDASTPYTFSANTSERSLSRNNLDSSRSTNTSGSSVDAENVVSDNRKCQSNSHYSTLHNKNSESCCCQLCPENTEKPDGVSSKPVIITDGVVKKVLEEVFAEQIQKALGLHHNRSAEEADVQAQMAKELKSLREKQAAESKLKDYLKIVESNRCEEDSGAYSFVSTPEPPSSTFSENSVYSSEFIPKTKPKFRSNPNDSEFSSNSSVPILGRNTEVEDWNSRNTANDSETNATADSTLNGKIEGERENLSNTVCSEVPFNLAPTANVRIDGANLNQNSISNDLKVRSSPTPTINEKVDREKLSLLRSFVLQHTKNRTDSVNE